MKPTSQAFLEPLILEKAKKPFPEQRLCLELFAHHDALSVQGHYGTNWWPHSIIAQWKGLE